MDTVGCVGDAAGTAGREEPRDGCSRGAGGSAFQGQPDRIELACGDERYPPLLKGLAEPPLLYATGDARVLSTRCISIVGARRATPYGIAVAELAGRIAAESGLTVVSGGALGCDAAAGAAALAAGGKHVIVSGVGADRVYPASSRAVFEEVRGGRGAVVSLERWGSPPKRYAFPKRNRIIAGLSEALFICEAGMPSGTFSTAEAAVELGREVFCAPGSILSPLSRGTNHLIAAGAVCIEDEGALEEAISRVYGSLRFCHGPGPGVSGLDAQGKRIVSALVASPLRMDALAALLGTDVVSAVRAVGGLAGEGLVERLPDGRFSLTKDALELYTSFGHNRGR